MALATPMLGIARLQTTVVPRWLHWCAVFTVAAAFPLLFLGAEVTTHQVGMVDQVGMRTPWHLFEVAREKIEEGNWGFLIEHSHRTFGWLVGAGAIVVAVGLYLSQKKSRLRWLGVAALFAVTLQGLLGKYRVDAFRLVGPGFANELALIHGCFAQLVFALLVSVAFLTSPTWLDTDRAAHFSEKGAADLPRVTSLTAVLVYGQVVLGAIVRHTGVLWGPRIHLLLAFVLVAVVAYSWMTYRRAGLQGSILAWPFAILVLLMGLQLLLGVEAWMSKFATPQWTQLKPLIANKTFMDLPRSLHSLTGALLFATSVVVALGAWQIAAPARANALSPPSRQEGAA